MEYYPGGTGGIRTNKFLTQLDFSSVDLYIYIYVYIYIYIYMYSTVNK